MPLRIHKLFLDVTLSDPKSTVSLKPSGSSGTPTQSSPFSQSAVSQGGLPLPPIVRNTMERTLGSTFGSVRVHPESSLPSQLRATAFAQGDHVHFSPGSYQPSTPSGLGLIGHELAHIVQQRAGQVGNAPQTSRPNSLALDPFERQANAVERMFSRGHQPSTLASQITRRVSGSGSLAGTVHRKASGGMLRRAGGGPFNTTQVGKPVSATSDGEGSLTIARLSLVWPESGRHSGRVDRKPSVMELARIRGAGGQSGPVPPGFDQRLEGSAGVPLPEDVREEMESLLGVDLKGVKVHLDSPAQEAARLVNAEAFTLGEDVFFATNRYLPHTADGMGLLAHELTHVAQGLGGAPTLQPGGVERTAPLELGGGFSVAGHDAFERQAEVNERFVSRSFRGGTDPMSISLASDVMRGGPSSMFAMADSPTESIPLRPIDDGPVKEALDLIRTAGPTLGSAADVAIGFVPIVGDLYDLLCGILGRAIFTWESLDVWDRLLCFAGVIPIPFVSGAVMRRGKRVLSWLLSEHRAIRILNELTQRGIEFIRRNIGRLRTWLANLGTGIVDVGRGVGTRARSFARGLRERVGRMFRKKTPTPPVRPVHDLFESMFERKLRKAALAKGVDPQELLEQASKQARDDMEQVLKEGMGGLRFKSEAVAGALKKQDIEVLDWKIREYNQRVAKGGGDHGLIDYGKVPAKAGGAAAIAGKDQVYLLSGNPITNFVLALFKGNIPRMHEMGHVLQYAYFHRLLKHLDVPMSQKDLKLLQVYLETKQKGALEGMAYLFGTPIPVLGQAFRRKLFRNFMSVVEENVLARRYSRWKTHMATAEAVRQGAIAGGIFGAVPGVSPLISIGGGALISILDRIGPLRKPLPGAPDLEELRAELAHERDPHRARLLSQAIQQLEQPGLPLELSVRNRLERYLGEPLDDVRVHQGLLAERLAWTLGAEAVTFGGQVVMGAGSYSPDTPEGLGLLAHEATHVVQDRQGHTLDMGRAQHARLEAEAHAVERSVVRRARARTQPRFVPPSEPEYRHEPVRPAPVEDVPDTTPKQAVPAALSRALAKAIDERPEQAQADQIERVRQIYGPRGMTREDFLEELSERVLDLMHEEIELAAERGGTQ